MFPWWVRDRRPNGAEAVNSVGHMLHYCIVTHGCYSWILLLITIRQGESLWQVHIHQKLHQKAFNSQLLDIDIFMETRVLPTVLACVPSICLAVVLLVVCHGKN